MGINALQFLDILQDTGNYMNSNNDYPVAVELPVVWGEMDAFGHVNNIVFFRYF